MAAQREWFEKDYYKTLGVAEDASAKEITKAYRKLARTYHPDANRDDPSAEDRFKEISSAYDVLGDEARRKEYDEVRRLGPMGGFGQGAGEPGGFTFNMGDADFGDLLGGLFGRGGRGGRGRGASGVAPQRGNDLEAELTLDSTPASPVLSTTTAPAATACSLNWRVRSAVLSGIGYSPNDSLRMSAWSTVSAQSRPSRIVELKAALALPNTFIPISDAPGAIPRTVMLQPAGSGWAGLTKSAMS